MMNGSVNLQQLIEQMAQARREGTDLPTILGGRFAAARLDDFVEVWRQRWNEIEMPWRIWEYVSKIEFADGPATTEYLQRGEVFGTGGHLSLRRDGNHWLWHYIGPWGQMPPVGFDQPPECEDFWRENQDVPLRCYEEQVLLWGEEIVDEEQCPAGRWWEDRVAAARLEYPRELSGYSRVYLTFWRYTESGRTAFVWYRALGDANA
jgi:hypothetical protein